MTSIHIEPKNKAKFIERLQGRFTPRVTRTMSIILTTLAAYVGFVVIQAILAWAGITGNGPEGF